MREGAKTLARLEGLHLLGVEVGLEHDGLAVLDELLDLKGAHDALHALVLHAVHEGADRGELRGLLRGMGAAVLTVLVVERDGRGD